MNQQPKRKSLTYLLISTVFALIAFVLGWQTLVSVWQNANPTRAGVESVENQIPAAAKELEDLAPNLFEASLLPESKKENSPEQPAVSEESVREAVEQSLEIAQLDMRNLRYENALNNIKTAAGLQAMTDDVLRAWLEVAFFLAESGQTQRAGVLLDSIASYASIRLSPSADLRSKMAAIDSLHFHYLFEQKYYPEMVLVQGGTFEMGCPADRDTTCEQDEILHPQEVGNFFISKYEITVWQFALYCADRNRDIANFLMSHWADPGDNPVVKVSWHEAMDYAAWLNDKKGLSDTTQVETNIPPVLESNYRGFRLPTEAEWEFASRGGAREYATAEELDKIGWTGKNSSGRTRSVGKKQPNALGLYDMSGNVWEWCWDWYGDYPQTLTPHYTGPQNGEIRVIRGGSWGSIDKYCRATNRGGHWPDKRHKCLGFRLARTPGGI